MTPFFSIITIAYNEAGRIESTCRSVVSQTCKDYEWIVVDGGSNDGTLMVLDRYKEHFAYFTSELDNGIYNAMNKGIKRATGQYLFFLNGGDSFYNENVLRDVMQLKPASDLVFGNVNVLNKKGEGKLFRMPPSPSKHYLLRKTIPHQATFTKYDLFKRIGLYDESYKIAADFKFTLTAVFRHKCSLTHVPVTVSNHFGDGVSNTNATLRVREKERAKKEVLDLATKLKLYLASTSIGRRVLSTAKSVLK